MALGTVVYTALGWIIVGGAAGALYFYYNADQGTKRAFRAKGNRTVQLAQKAVDTVDPRVKSTPKKKPQLKSKQSDAAKPTRPPASDVTQQTPVARSSALEKETDDASFAHELAQRRKGASFKTNATEATRQKTVKQSNANKRAESAPSSPAIAESHEGSSPVEESFPELSPTELPSGKDVSDMLEAPTPAPGVLRLTEPEFKAPARKAREQKPAPEVESKKQRQNRKKKEEAQAVREEQEAERRVLLEKQRRNAREARGEPAKNGVAATAPANSPWMANGTHVPSAIEAATESPLLDTLATDNASVSSSVAPATPASNSANGGAVHYSLPDEDEQMRQLIEQDDSAWTSVPSKARKNGLSQDKPSQGAVQPLTANSKRPNLNNSQSQLHRLGDDVEA